MSPLFIIHTYRRLSVVRSGWEAPAGASNLVLLKMMDISKASVISIWLRLHGRNSLSFTHHCRVKPCLLVVRFRRKLVRISKLSLCDVFPAKSVRTCFQFSVSACSQGHMLELTNQPSSEGTETHTQVCSFLISLFRVMNWMCSLNITLTSFFPCAHARQSTHSSQSKVHCCTELFHKHNTHPPYSNHVSCGTWRSEWLQFSL